MPEMDGGRREGGNTYQKQNIAMAIAPSFSLEDAKEPLHSDIKCATYYSLIER